MLPSEFSRLSNKCGSLEQSIAVNDFPGTVDLGRAAAERPIYGTSGRFTRTIVELAGKVLLVWMRKGARWTEHQTARAHNCPNACGIDTAARSRRGICVA
jgi:hypothetical protein